MSGPETISTVPTKTHTDLAIKTIPQTKPNYKNLPKFLLSNIQSFGSSENTDKTTEVEAVLDHNGIDIATLTETWLSENNKDQINLNNYVNFHLIRKNTLRSSGGVSILIRENIPANIIKIKVPDHIEALWVSVRPNWLPRAFSNIIVCGVYYPGHSSEYAPDQSDIILHLTETIHYLSSKYANPLFVIMGDFNDLKTNEIRNACSLKQVVKVPTRKNATLDLILTNKSNNFYKEPITLPSISTSDHLCVLYEPIAYTNINHEKTKVFTRKFHKSAMIAFGAWLISFNWQILINIPDVNLKVAYFFTIMWASIERFFPQIQVIAAKDDKKWITPKIKTLIADRQKAHLCGNTQKRNLLAAKVRLEIKKAKRKYNEAKAKTFSNANAKDWFQHISKIINNGKRNNIVLNNIPELSQKPFNEIVDIVNNHFATICKTYPPTNHSQTNNNPSEADLTLISEMYTYKLLNKFSKKLLVQEIFKDKYYKCLQFLWHSLFLTLQIVP